MLKTLHTALLCFQGLMLVVLLTSKADLFIMGILIITIQAAIIDTAKDHMKL